MGFKGIAIAIGVVALIFYGVYYYYHLPAPPQTQETYVSLAKDIVTEINRMRVHYGVASLAENSLLSKAAFLHSLDMASHGFFEHTGSDGSTLPVRLMRVGYRYVTCGENLLLTETPTLLGVFVIWFIPIPIPAPHKDNSTIAQEVVNAWLNSPGHRAVLLEPSFREVGVGIAANGTKLYVTADFGA